jgi:hypothetical protein
MDIKKITDVAIVVCLLVFSLVLNAQEGEVPALITDRPDLTESANIVPKGALQIETGFVFEGDKSRDLKESNFSMFTTLLRYGVNEYFELRLGSSLNMKTTEVGGESASIFGVNYVDVGMKFNMVEGDGLKPQIAFLTMVIIPKSGEEEYSPEYLTPSLALAFSQGLSKKFSLGYNIGAVWNGLTAKPAAKYSVALAYSLAEKLGSFVEIYGYFPQDEQGVNIFDFGFTYLLRPNLQLDASAGFGLSEVSPDYFVNAGISWRIPH